MSLRGTLLDLLAARLDTIKETNGYDLTVKKVYYDKIPMGIQLASHEVPCIFLLDSDDRFKPEFKILDADWTIDLQLWNKQVSDKEQAKFVRAVFKAIFANSPTAERVDEFRIHPAIYGIVPDSVVNDLHMIEANRVTLVRFVVKYRTKPYDL